MSDAERGSRAHGGSRGLSSFEQLDEPVGQNAGTLRNDEDALGVSFVHAGRESTR
jgi:hypothetical protein